MARSDSVDKRQEWQARLARHLSSGLSVARFCAEEQVSENSFYYWAKRLKSSSPTPSGAQVPVTRSRLRMPAPDGNGQVATVRFRWKTGPEVWVPADCLEVIRCLAECLTSAVVSGGERFQEVVVKV